MKHTTLLAAALCLVAACSKKDDAKPAAKADDKPVAADPTTADKPADPPAAKPAADMPKPPPAAAGPSADESKDFLGLDLPPMGKWKPTWDADAKVAKWENDDFMTGIVIRVVKDKLDSIDDLKEAAPMMMQFGTAITEVVETKVTDKGWYAVVKDDDGKNVEMGYIRKFGDSQIVCSGNVTPRKDAMSAGGIKKEEIIKACESVKPKA
jgi:hypothetical protein|nr:hypothetical protein [Kofleriaceae bacterium]